MSRNVEEYIALYLSSDSIVESMRETFEFMDPPPTRMTVRVRLPTMELTRARLNLQYRICLSSLFLNCVWRDADDPSDKLTANAGTSVSNQIFVTFYAGAGTTQRLLQQSDKLPSGLAYDYVIRRTQNNIGEFANFMYYTNVDAFDSALWFENQFTHHFEEHGLPGEFIGMLDPAALNRIQREEFITVTMVNNRTDSFVSPFWYNKFLTGVSLYLPARGQYDIVPSSTIYREYYRKIKNVSVSNELAGVYYPQSFYTLDQPLHPLIYTGTGTISSMTASPEGCVVLPTTLHLQQIGIDGNLADLASLPLSRVEDTMARSDETTYSYAVPSQGIRQEDLPSHLFPNGAWRGTSLPPDTTSKTGYESPFPWERRLTQEQLQLIDGTGTLPTTLQVLPTNNYLFLPSGDDSLGIGERSVQYDLGSSRFVNKLQIVFPKSQERWQPTALNATLQRAWLTTLADSFEDQFPAYWFRGYQHKYPYATIDGGTIRYIHTLSQDRQVSGDGGVMRLGTHTFRVSSTYAIPGYVNATLPDSVLDLPSVVPLPDYTDTDTFRVGSAQTFQDWPNDVNPAYDFERYEYGPFLQQPTISWMKRLEYRNVDSALAAVHFPIAIARKDWTCEWQENEKPLDFFFNDFRTWQRTFAARRVLGGMLYHIGDTAYEFLPAVPPYRPRSTFGMTTSSSLTPAAYAFDHDFSTIWMGYTATNQRTTIGDSVLNGDWIQLECPTPVRIHRIDLEPSLTFPSRDVTIQSSLHDTETIVGEQGRITVVSRTDPAARIVFDPSTFELTFTSHATFVPGENSSMTNTVSDVADWEETRHVGRPELPSDAHVAEYVWLQLPEGFEKVSGLSFHVTNTCEAPERFLVAARSMSMPVAYWQALALSNYTTPYTWESYQKVDKWFDTNLAEFQATGLLVTVYSTPLYLEVFAPRHTLSVTDKVLGRTFTIQVPQKRYVTSTALAQTIQNEFTSEDVTFIVTASGSVFTITTTSTLFDGSTGPHDIVMHDTLLARGLGFTEFDVTRTVFVSQPHTLFPTSPGRTSFTLRLYQPCTTNPTGYTLLGSPDGVEWTQLYNTMNDRWASTAPSIVDGINAELAYSFYRLVVTQSLDSTMYDLGLYTIHDGANELRIDGQSLVIPQGTYSGTELAALCTTEFLTCMFHNGQLVFTTQTPSLFESTPLAVDIGLPLEITWPTQISQNATVFVPPYRASKSSDGEYIVSMNDIFRVPSFEKIWSLDAPIRDAIAIWNTGTGGTVVTMNRGPLGTDVWSVYDWDTRQVLKTTSVPRLNFQFFDLYPVSATTFVLWARSTSGQALLVRIDTSGEDVTLTTIATPLDSTWRYASSGDILNGTFYFVAKKNSDSQNYLIRIALDGSESFTYSETVGTSSESRWVGSETVMDVAITNSNIYFLTNTIPWDSADFHDTRFFEGSLPRETVWDTSTLTIRGIRPNVLSIDYCILPYTQSQFYLFELVEPNVSIQLVQTDLTRVTSATPTTLHTSSTLVNIGLTTQRCSLANIVLYCTDYDNTAYNAAIDVDYTSISQRDMTYASIHEWLLDKYNLYQIGSDQPLLDYIVKEEYYFAPTFDQNDTQSYFDSSQTGVTDTVQFTTYRPQSTALQQKMVQPRFAQGRYVGIAPAFGSVNRGFTTMYQNTRSTIYDRMHRCYSWRLCHQLFSYTSDGASVSNIIDTTSTEAAIPATLTKTIAYGMLTDVTIVQSGKRYTSITPSRVSLGSETEFKLYDEALSQYAVGILGNVYSVSESPVFEVETEEDPEEVSYESISSLKNNLARSATFRLFLVPKPIT